MSTVTPARLTAYDREVLARARVIAGVDDVRDYTGEPGHDAAGVIAFGAAQARIRELLNLVGRLAGEGIEGDKP